LGADTLGRGDQGGGGGGGGGGNLLLEKVNIENNVIEFALARLVAQLTLWGLICDC